MVYYTPPVQAEARAIATILGVAAVQPMPSPSPIRDLRGADVLVMAGPDLAQKAGAGTTTTSTTARR